MGVYTGPTPTLLAGELPDATKLKQITDFMAAETSAWVAWTPTLTNLTVGSGALVARYQQIGKTVQYLILFSYGTGSAVGPTPTISLPAPAHANYFTTLQFIGSEARYAGTSAWIGEVVLATSSTISLHSYTSTSVFTALTATSPWTWTTGYKIFVSGFYEAA